MKEKLLIVACAVSILSSAAAVAASVAARTHAAEPAAPAANADLRIVTENSETRVYSFRNEGHLCFIASTRGGSGISLQCPP
jgi:curli biogenesis system outer membrane secretion channel CsgG